MLRVFRSLFVLLLVGGFLLSHTLPGAVPLALAGLASGFGMGPGVSPPLLTTGTGFGAHTRMVGVWVLWCVRYWISGRGHTRGGVLVWWCLFGGLVPVACTHCCVCSSGLSTPSSVGHLVLKPHLKTGFPLRCFQRLSLPYVANQRCSWRNNWHTRGTSVPVLSY